MDGWLISRVIESSAFIGVYKQHLTCEFLGNKNVNYCNGGV